LDPVTAAEWRLWQALQGSDTAFLGRAVLRIRPINFFPIRSHILPTRRRVIGYDRL